MFMEQREFEKLKEILHFYKIWSVRVHYHSHARPRNVKVFLQKYFAGTNSLIRTLMDPIQLVVMAQKFNYCSEK